MGQRCAVEHNQFLATSRLLDVEKFHLGDHSFTYQNVISSAAYENNHISEIGNKHFTDFINSYEECGYDGKSSLTVDNNLRLIDGNHRIGLHLYMGIDEIQVRIP